MRIAIDCRWLADDKTAFSSRIFYLLPYLLQAGAKHHWLLLSNKPIEGLPEGDHVECMVFGNALQQAAAKSWWYDHTLPDRLRKYGVDLFLGAGGIISKDVSVPQISLLHNMLEYGGGLAQYLKDHRWFRKRMEILFEKSAVILVDYIERQGLSRYVDDPVVLSKLAATGWYGNTGVQMQFAEGNEYLKQQLTGGKEYFFCETGWQKTEQGLDLLLAFAAFKKRMQSGIRLVLLGEPEEAEAWQKKLASFRYREEVAVLSPDACTFSRRDLLGQAFACLHLSEQELVAPLIFAMQTGAPVIAAHFPVYKKIGGEQILFVGKEPGETLSDRLMQIYRDDTGREKRRRQAREDTSMLTPENTALQLLKQIEDRFLGEGGLSLSKE